MPSSCSAGDYSFYLIKFFKPFMVPPIDCYSAAVLHSKQILPKSGLLYLNTICFIRSKNARKIAKNSKVFLLS